MVVVNHRGLSGCKLSTPKLYHGASTEDFREPLRMVHQKNPGKKIMAIGCSLGANKLAMVMGEDGEECIIDAAVCI